MTVRLLVSAAVLGMLSAGLVASAQTPAPPSFEISAVIAGGPDPAEIWVELGPDRIPLTKAGAVYAGARAVGDTRLTRRATLVARYGDERVTLPVRFLPAEPRMRLGIYAEPAPACVLLTLLQLETAPSNYDAQLRAYFRAKRLAAVSGPSACVGRARHRVLRAWFDRSYALANQNSHIALDEDAQAALKANGDGQYADLYSARMAARRVQLDYRYQQQLLEGGDLAGALAVNDELSGLLTGDAELAAAVETFQKIDLDRLAEDREFLANRLEARVASPQ